MPDSHRLAVWRKAHELGLGGYRATAGFPTDERFGMCSQLRRAAVSVVPTSLRVPGDLVTRTSLGSSASLADRLPSWNVRCFSPEICTTCRTTATWR